MPIGSLLFCQIKLLWESRTLGFRSPPPLSPLTTVIAPPTGRLQTNNNNTNTKVRGLRTLQTADLDSLLFWLMYGVAQLLQQLMGSHALPPDSYVIVGAGVFGTSTAIHLVHKYPSAHIVLIDRSPFPHEAGASWDWSKVVRADYTNLLYMELALEALEAWRTEPLYTTYYHQSGLVWADPTDRPKVIMDNYQKLHASEKYRMSTPAEVKGLWGGVYSDTNYTNVSDILINESSGWAEATNAVRQVTQAAVDAGVQYIATDVDRVIFDQDGTATGVLTADGTTLSAKHVILATGAYTPKLLLDSAPKRPEIHADHRMIAAAICEGSVKLSSEDADFYAKAPVYVNEVEDVIGQL